MILSRGMRDKLSNYINVSMPIDINMTINGLSVYDYTCFAVDSANILSDDRYMVFYNQTSSPGGEIKYSPNNEGASFNVNLCTLPPTIQRLVFTVSIDGDGTMGNISKHEVTISQNGNPVINMEVPGSFFKEEKAIISFELYIKDEWRISATASGFNGGLSALLSSFGGKEAESKVEPVTAATASMQQPMAQSRPISLKKNEQQLTHEIMGKISLSKDKEKLEKHVVNLSKCVVDLSIQNSIDMSAMRAKVVVVLDYSWSMSFNYNNGIIQNTLDRLVPLGLTFDDNGSLDVYLFQNTYMKMTDLNLNNYTNYVNDIIKRSDYQMGGTYYEPVISAITIGDTAANHGVYSAIPMSAPGIVNNEIPTFILFITDGDNSDKANTNDILKKVSGMNVFIQFIGIGDEQFNYLMALDTMQGRVRDNTGFSKMESLANVSDNDLYNNILNQFSQWLRGMQ